MSDNSFFLVRIVGVDQRAAGGALPKLARLSPRLAERRLERVCGSGKKEQRVSGVRKGQ